MTMRVTTDFIVPLPVDDAWTLLQDVERVARWLPGAILEGGDGESFNGTVRVKLGPMMVDYRGNARFAERDEEAHRVVLEATGREQRGSGMAKAMVVTQLEEDRAGGTHVSVAADIDISGRPAQLGQSLMQDVAKRLVGEFSERMREELEESGGGADADGRGALGGTAGLRAAIERGTRSEDADVLDLGRAVGPELLRRALPVCASLVALVAALIWSAARARAKKRGGR